MGVVFSLRVPSESTNALPQTSLPPSEECPSSTLADSSTKPLCTNRRKQCVVDSENPPAEDGAFKSKGPSDPTCLPSDSTYQREVPKNFKSLELLRTAVAAAADLGTQSIGLDARKLAAVHAAKSLSRHVRHLLSPFGQPSSTGGGVDKPDMIALLEKKRLKLKRNRKWRSKRRRHAAIALEKVRSSTSGCVGSVSFYRALIMSSVFEMARNSQIQELIDCQIIGRCLVTSFIKT